MTTRAAHGATPRALVVEVTRGCCVESRHRVAAAVFDCAGRPVGVWGATEAPVFPRSAVKPFQAVPLLETGAAERFRLEDAEIAIACGSHEAEQGQIDLVGRWLTRLGLSEADLECGPQGPRDREAAEALVRAGKPPSSIHNNCSGKHAGFLTTALHLGAPTAGYSTADHPVQKRVAEVLGDLAGFDPAVSPIAVDGCGIPTIAMPLTALARAMACLAFPRGLPSPRADALRRIFAAMTAHPRMVAGLGLFDTEAISVVANRLIVKTGAEGVLAAALKEPGLGIALKAEDGAKRAAECAMAALLVRYASPNSETELVLKRYAEQPVLNHAGIQVGLVRIDLP